MSRSHASERTKAWLEELGPFTSIERGSSLKFCSVAEGEADVYPRLGPTSIWDTAAGHAVLNAVGGVVVREDGVELNYSDPSKVLNPFFIAWG
jgi:3'(2'), 5'-bisphosphate nucleotidase